MYGGDFGDQPNDFNFVADGMVWPDRTPHPGMDEFKYLAQPVRAELIDVAGGRVRVRNKRYFTTLDDLRGTWKLRSERHDAPTGRDSGAPRGGTNRRRVHASIIQWPRDGEAFLVLEWTTREATPWAAAGHVVATEQLAGPITFAPTRRNVAADATANQLNDAVELVRGEQRVAFDATGITRWGDGETVVEAPRPNVWRAPTDNDNLQIIFRNLEHGAALWNTLGLAQPRNGAPNRCERSTWTARQRSKSWKPPAGATAGTTSCRPNATR